MALDSRLVVRRGAFVLDVALAAADSEVVALLGPNGSGKSTLLAALAGLLPVESGFVEVNGRTLTRAGGGFSPEAGDRIAVPAHRRGIGLLGQDPLLFPHLSARDNVAFGLQARGSATPEARLAASTWLASVELEGKESHRPSALSGGEQQRVAIARALAASPELLLLDEPMASLDVESAAAIRTMLRDHLSRSGLTTVLVTHDVVDAVMLADRVVILDGGRIVDDGPTARVLEYPANPFAAALVGMNFVRGVAEDGVVVTAEGRRFSGSRGDGADGHPGAGMPPGANACAVFPPTALTLRARSGYPSPPATVNTWEATVAALEPAASGIRLRLVGDSVVAELPTSEVLAAGIAPGSAVALTVADTAVRVYPSP